jgi:hypothetical protein
MTSLKINGINKMTTTAQEKPINNCSSCNRLLEGSSDSRIMPDNTHYCGKCFKLYDTPFLSPMINIFAYILLIGSLYGMKGLWPSGYSNDNYMPALTIGFSGIITFLILLATSKALSYLREITKGTIKQANK